MSSNTQNQAAAAACNGTDDGSDAAKSNQSEDTLIFGSAPSHLFDEIAIRIDNLLTEEVSALPLLPRKKGDRSKESGEEILLADLRGSYKKNLDLLENYCARNVFTVASFNKTKRRKVLEHFLKGEDGAEGGKEAEVSGVTIVPESKFEPPAKNEELPTAQQIMAMDQEILLARQRLLTEKQRRVKLSRQISRLKGAMDSLNLVQDALKGGNGNGFDELQQKLQKAVDGHQEIKTWNGKAEEVIALLDKFKKERGGETDGDVKPLAVTRDADEKDRRRVWEEMNGGEPGREEAGSGTEIASLLKKLREK